MRPANFAWNDEWGFDLPLFGAEGMSARLWTWGGPHLHHQVTFPWRVLDAPVTASEPLARPDAESAGVEGQSEVASDVLSEVRTADDASDLVGPGAPPQGALSVIEGAPEYLREPTMVILGASGILWFDPRSGLTTLGALAQEEAVVSGDAGMDRLADRVVEIDLESLFGLYGFSGAASALYSHALLQPGEPAQLAEGVTGMAAGGDVASTGNLDHTGSLLQSVDLESTDMPLSASRILETEIELSAQMPSLTPARVYESDVSLDAPSQMFATHEHDASHIANMNEVPSDEVIGGIVGVSISDLMFEAALAELSSPSFGAFDPSAASSATFDQAGVYNQEHLLVQLFDGLRADGAGLGYVEAGWQMAAHQSSTAVASLNEHEVAASVMAIHDEAQRVAMLAG